MEQPIQRLLAIVLVLIIGFSVLLNKGLETVVADGTSSRNLVVNGGFETGNFSGWTLESSGMGDLTSLNYPPVAGNPHSGSYSIQTGYYDIGQGGNHFLAYCDFTLAQKLMPVLSSNISEVSCWMYGVGGFLKINYTDGTSSWTNFTSVPFGPWTKFSILPDLGKIIDSVIINGVSGGQHFGTNIDDIQVIYRLNPTSTSIFCCPNLANANSPVTITAWVSNIFETMYTGSVLWSSNSTSGFFTSTQTILSSADNHNLWFATTSFQDSKLGAVNITATYTGDSTDAPSSASAILQIGPSSNLVANGGFETGDLSSWTIESYYGSESYGNPPYATTTNPRSGTYCLQAGPYNHPLLMGCPFTIAQKLPPVSTSLIRQVCCWGANLPSAVLEINYTDGTSDQVSCSISYPQFSNDSWYPFSITPTLEKTLDSIIISSIGTGHNVYPCFDDVEIIASIPQVLALNGVTAWHWTSNTAINSAASGDVDNDGVKEIVTGGYFNDGSRNVAQLIEWKGVDLSVDRLTGWYWTGNTMINSIAVGDVDGDGQVEIVTGGYFNDGSRNVAQIIEWNGATLTVDRSTSWYWTSNTVINSVAIGDVDGDGQVEIVTGGYFNDGVRNNAQLIEWNGATLTVDRLTGWFWTSNTVINSVAIGDVDLDGQTEIVTAGCYNDGARNVAQLVVWTGSNLGVDRLTGWYWTGNTVINSVTLGDVNSDGKTEIVTGGQFNDGARDVAQLAVWSGSSITVENVNSWYWTANTSINSVGIGDLSSAFSNEIFAGGTFYYGICLNSQLTVWKMT